MRWWNSSKKWLVFIEKKDDQTFLAWSQGFGIFIGKGNTEQKAIDNLRIKIKKHLVNSDKALEHFNKVNKNIKIKYSKRLD